MPVNSYNSLKQEKNTVVRLFRSPTLDTIKMVEKAIDKHSGEYTKRKIWGKLPKKVMWGTYTHILDYLQEINKIAVSKNGILVYIWSPNTAKKFMKLKRKGF